MTHEEKLQLCKEVEKTIGITPTVEQIDKWFKSKKPASSNMKDNVEFCADKIANIMVGSEWLLGSSSEEEQDIFFLKMMRKIQNCTEFKFSEMWTSRLAKIQRELPYVGQPEPVSEHWTTRVKPKLKSKPFRNL